MTTFTPGASSYGTALGVAAYVGLYTTDRVFTVATNPTEETVVHWIDQVSALLNAALGKYGVATPVTAVAVKPVLVGVVEQYVAELCHYANGTGRLVTIDRAGISPWKIIRNELFQWALEGAPGLIAGGAGTAPSTQDQIDSIAFDGDSGMFPIFQRNAFGNRFRDWSGHGGGSTE